MDEILRRGVASGQEEEASKDGEHESAHREELERVEERTSVGPHSQSKHHGKEQEQQQEEALCERALLSQEHCNRGNQFLAHNGDNFPVVGARSISVVQETVLFADLYVRKSIALLSERESSPERKSDHPEDHA